MMFTKTEGAGADQPEPSHPKHDYFHRVGMVQGIEPDRLVKASFGLLRAIDHGLAKHIWERASPTIKSTVPGSGFLAILKKIRGAAGALVGREWHSLRSMKIKEGNAVPPGLYASVVFAAEFGNSGPVFETVSLRLDDDGVWRFTGYRMNRRQAEPSAGAHNDAKDIAN